MFLNCEKNVPVNVYRVNGVWGRHGGTMVSTPCLSARRRWVQIQVFLDDVYMFSVCVGFLCIPRVG